MTTKLSSLLVAMGVRFLSPILTRVWEGGEIEADDITCAAMFDLAKDETSHKLINEFWAHNKIVSAVCHGPAALAYVKLPSGEYLLSGQSVTGFSNAEEDQAGLSDAMPFMLEDQLNTASGGKYVKAAEAWGPKVVVSGAGRIITAQNPASAGPIGQAIYDGIFGELTTRDEV
jgi:putative intracellular protease/amidase